MRRSLTILAAMAAIQHAEAQKDIGPALLEYAAARSKPKKRRDGPNLSARQARKARKAQSAAAHKEQ